MDSATLLLSIGAEGGSMAIYGKELWSKSAQYRVLVADQTPLMLPDELGGVAIHRDSGWLPSWRNALAALDRYPWIHLHVIFVDQFVKDDVWAAFDERASDSDEVVRETVLNRWRDRCGRVNT